VQLLSHLCLLVFVVTVTVVGARMLLLARRTRGRPELLVGAGALLVAGVGLPASVGSGFGQAVAEVAVPVWVASELATQVGIFLMYLFTQQVFRPGTRLAKALVTLAATSMAVGLAGAGRALAVAAPEAGSVEVTGPWLLLCYAGYVGCFLWSAAEALRRHVLARRRLTLGLAEPVVADRLLLWGIFGLAAAGVVGANALGVLLGENLSTSPVVLLPMAVLGLAASAAIYLAFLPPAPYLRWVEARARARDDAARQPAAP
jgi:hypothetical protein